MTGVGHGPAVTPPAVPRHAATVILLRDGPRGPQTWLLTRRREMSFAAGMSVYPGGRVDPADAEVPLARPARAGELAARFGVGEPLAHAVLVAACRELFEETGVLLTAPTAPSGMEAVRTALEAREVGFATVLADRGLAVDGDAFHPWARWLTPEAEPRRYDTFFFLATPPAGVEARDVTTESTTATWVDVAAALSGDAVLMPPTLVTLEQVGRHATAADVVAAAEHAELGRVMPVLARGEDGPTATLPDGRVIALRRLP